MIMIILLHKNASLNPKKKARKTFCLFTFTELIAVGEKEKKHLISPHTIFVTIR